MTTDLRSKVYTWYCERLEVLEWWEDTWLSSHLSHVAREHYGSAATKQRHQRRRQTAWKRYKLAAEEAAKCRNGATIQSSEKVG